MSDSDSGLVRVSSVKKPEYNEAPRDIDYKIKVKEEDKPFGMLYTLKLGQSLPYEPDLSEFQVDYHIKFQRNLEPMMAGWTAKKDGKYWIFKREAVEEKRNQTVVNKSVEIQDVSLVSSLSEDFDDQAPLNNSSLFDNSIENIEDPNEQNQMEELIVMLENSVAPFRCALCSFICAVQSVCVIHIKSEHPGWRDEAQSRKLAVKKKVSPHNNPTWKEDLRKGFKEIIIEKCTKLTRDAVEENEIIKDQSKKRAVRNEMIHTVIDHLIEVHGGVACPKLPIMREIVAMMGVGYPNMFQEGSAGTEMGYGFGGSSGLKRLPDQMVDRFRDRERKKRSKEVGDDEEVPVKRGKRKDIYGLDNQKFYTQKRDPKAEDEIAHTNDVDDFNKREAVYAANRAALAHQIRNSRKNIRLFCRGFFKSPGHLAAQFEYVTNTESLVIAVRENFRKQTDFLNLYLTHKMKTVEFRDKLAQINEKIDVEFGGSTTYGDIETMRMAGSEFDSDGTVLIRYQSELPATTASPFIVAVQIEKMFIFELHVEKKLLIGNMDLAEAIGAFLHLSFVFDLEYVKESETLCDIWQRKYAGYGDDTGSRTNGKKSSAQNKLNKYEETLGQLLTK